LQCSDPSDDSILVECWKKENKVEDNMLVPLLGCVSVDTFETLCFVVEVKEMQSDSKRINNGITLVKP